MKIIVGLGNPGQEYENTRHNAGFMAVNALAEELDLEWEESKKFQACIAKTGETILVKPSTFMNLSGRSVSTIMNFYKLVPRSFLGLKKDSDLSSVLTVIHDDLDIEPGKYKVSIDSRSAGHNGVQSIIEHLKTKNFTRIRLGIKPPADNQIPGIKYVLQKIGPIELDLLRTTIQESLKELI